MINDLSRPLSVNEIEFRVQSINNGKYATILAYKDARADMKRLDDAVGPLYWKREHTRDNQNCIVSIYDSAQNQWVSKEDTGTESMAEKQKGLASDSFKRACFNWGIGRELYDYPVISIKLNDDEIQETGRDRPKYKTSFKFNLKKWKWKVTPLCDNEYYVQAYDEKGKQRFVSHEKELITPEAYQKAVDAISNGKATLEQVKAKYLISEDQESALKALVKL